MFLKPNHLSKLFVIFSCLMIIACGNEDLEGELSSLGGGCSVNSECESGLSCQEGTCVKAELGNTGLSSGGQTAGSNDTQAVRSIRVA